MKKRLIILFLALMGMGVRAWAYNNTYALIIGVADYKNFSEYLAIVDAAPVYSCSDIKVPYCGVIRSFLYKHNLN